MPHSLEHSFGQFGSLAWLCPMVGPCPPPPTAGGMLDAVPALPSSTNQLTFNCLICLISWPVFLSACFKKQCRLDPLMPCFICLKIPDVFMLQKQRGSLFPIQQGFLAHRDVSALVATSRLPWGRSPLLHRNLALLSGHILQPSSFEELLFDKQSVWKAGTARMPSLVMNLAGSGDLEFGAHNVAVSG